MQETKVSIKNKRGEQLVGLKTVPGERKDKYPTAVLVHGFHVTKEEGGMFGEIAKRLAKEGILVYRFDFSGCGESEGDYIETSLTKLKDELRKILSFVRGREIVGKSKIGILAQSFGTSVAVALEPEVNSIILMGSLSSPVDSFTKYFGEGYNPKGVSEVRRSSGRITKVEPQFWKDFKKYDLLGSIRKIKCPILFIHGEKDEKVPLSQMEAYFKVANEPKERIILKDAKHSLKPRRGKMYKTVVDWFINHLS